MLIHYIKENIVQMIKKDKFLLCLIVCVQAISVLVILFAYGIFNHYNTKVEEVEGTSLKYTSQAEYIISPDGSSGYYKEVDKDDFIAFIKKVMPSIETKLKTFYVSGDLSEYAYEFYSFESYKDGKFINIEQQIKKFENTMVYGRYFTDEEIAEGKKVFFQPIREENHFVPEEIVLGDTTYKLSGTAIHEVEGSNMTNPEKGIILPFLSMPSNAKVIIFTFRLNIPLTKTEFDIVTSIQKEYLGDAFVIPEFEGIDNEGSRRVYRSLIYVAVLLTAISIMNYCMIYEYILTKRKKMLAISRICGCKTYQALSIYMIELLSVSIAILAIFEIIFVKLILPILKYKFEYIIYYFNKNFYIEFNIIYIAVLLVGYGILVLSMVRKTPNELIREV